MFPNKHLLACLGFLACVFVWISWKASLKSAVDFGSGSGVGGIWGDDFVPRLHTLSPNSTTNSRRDSEEHTVNEKFHVITRGREHDQMFGIVATDRQQLPLL